MLKIILFCFVLFLISPLLALDINIIYPVENDTINVTAIDSTYIFGAVSPPHATLLINKNPVPVYENGSFLSYVPVKAGDVNFECLLVLGDDSLIVNRTIYCFSHVTPIHADSVFIDAKNIRPHVDLELNAGDIVNLGFRGTPGGAATFSIDGIVADAPMIENPHPVSMYWGEAVFGQGDVWLPDSVAGFYHGSYVIQAADSARNDSIRFQLVDQPGDTVRARALGTLTINKSGIPRIAETMLELTVLRTGPRKSYYYFLPRGVKLWITGKHGRNYRVRLSETTEAWIEDYKIRFLPPGTPVPHRYVQLVRTTGYGAKSRVTVYTGAPLPYRIVQSTSPNSLKVLFYGVTADTDWIRYDCDDPLVQDIRWEQEAKNVYALHISLNQKHPWGYDARFDENNNFILDIKKTPRIGKRKRSALKDLIILLDPGHEPDTGAVGPTGFTEKEANLLLALTLAEKLKRRGAQVKFTRTYEGLALGVRQKQAMATEADILLSLHHNAIPVGVNPYKSRGTATFYYHPQSHDLARLVQKHLLDELELPNFGLYWDNLAMCRPTQMPAILLEPAFMMFPEEEMLVQTEEYREKCSKAIVEALIEFVLKYRD